MLSYEIFDDLVSGELDRGAVARGEPVDGARYLEDDESPFGWGQWSIDLGQSVWLFGKEAFGAVLGATLSEAAAADGQGRVPVSGADFARVLAEHGEEVAGIDRHEVMPILLLRIRTDGTLFDAMRAATWTTGGPERLVTLEEGAEVEPDWEERLGAVPNLALREHLSLLCLTAHWARGCGAFYRGPGANSCPPMLDWFGERPGHHTVAGWELGEGQAASAVLRIV
ncbi:hypothetical protein [Streptomyces sp. NPDC059816]|uniref:hypothetical protein n=1 Tax=Streptomyces sp. NPDC059816 TaxID=3346960 RepID=UPI003651C44E